MRASIRLIRPKQWLKNFFVYAPLIFAKELFEPSRLLEACKAFAVFSLAASAMYVINDLSDAPADRAHPENRDWRAR